jgi:hypothetical protein
MHTILMAIDFIFVSEIVGIVDYTNYDDMKYAVGLLSIPSALCNVKLL